MLEEKDIQRLIDVFATKEDLKDAVKNLSTKDDFEKIMNSIDNYAKKADAYFQEMVALSY